MEREGNAGVNMVIKEGREGYFYFVLFWSRSFHFICSTSRVTAMLQARAKPTITSA